MAKLTIDELLVVAAALPPMTRAQRREQVINWALGNLNASTNHRTTRAMVEAAYDRLHPDPDKEPSQ